MGLDIRGAIGTPVAVRARCYLSDMHKSTYRECQAIGFCTASANALVTLLEMLVAARNARKKYSDGREREADAGLCNCNEAGHYHKGD